LHAGLAQVDVHLLELFSNTGRFKHAIKEVVDCAVTCPLTKDSHRAVASKAVAGGLVLEERAVVPPAPVGSVQVEVFLVLVDLHGHPDALLPPETMVLRKDFLGFAVLAAGVEPTRAFGQEPCQEQDQCWEEDLHPDWYGPVEISREIDRATSDTSSKERTDKPSIKSAPTIPKYRKLYLPEGVVKSGDDTAMGRMGRLDNVKRSSCSQNGYTESEQQTATHELAYSTIARL
jgi:hypothetical protein